MGLKTKIRRNEFNKKNNETREIFVNSSTALLDWINFFLEDVTLAVGM